MVRTTFESGPRSGLSGPLSRARQLTDLDGSSGLPRAPASYGFGPWTGPPREMTSGATPRERQVACLELWLRVAARAHGVHASDLRFYMKRDLN